MDFTLDVIVGMLDIICVDSSYEKALLHTDQYQNY